ncbi:MAG: MBG domain-containing protein [Verrucomicrobiota bacterium]
MVKESFAFSIAAAMALIGPATAQERLADLLDDPATELWRPADRARVVARMTDITNMRRLDARTKAANLGLPFRSELPNGRIQEIADFEGGRPIYFTTDNSSAAISTGASLLQTSPYSLTGAGVTIGLWDGGSGRSTHQEFNGRLSVMDGASSADHATHVGGTLIAAGVVASARGMADAATVHSYDWNSDTTEMTARGATSAGEAGKIYLSNHSYGYVGGWNYVNNGTRVWEWYGQGTTAAAIEDDFGRYNNYSRDSDSLAFKTPYYLIFRSAGNERVDSPSTGQTVALSPGATTVVSYDPAIHPGGDGNYRGGFDSISFDAIAKNVVTIGSTADAVANGVRDPSMAYSSSFSSWGPTDDGRIKPDLVANGEALYSSLDGGDASYGAYSGTSMATPNATGSAALLIQQYGNLFPGQAMRASTLKGLLIHTADDRGNVGPDYKYGWGLVNVRAAADLVQDQHDLPLKQRITENQLTSTSITRTHSFNWDGISPISATLCWTDPAATALTTPDSRTARLVNNLNVKIIAPDGSEFLPFVMPFVGTWTQSSMDAPATTGINNTDNVEQVRIGAPSATGTYQAVVSFSGTLTNGTQNYSLLISGSSAEAPPPPPLTLTAVTPDSGVSGTVSVDLSGTGLRADTSVRFTRSGQSDITATGGQLIDETLRCQVNLTGAVTGLWNVVATNPNSETSTLAAAFNVIGAIWSENFDGPPAGWSSQATTGSNSWSLVTTQSKSPATSYFAPGPSTKSTTNLTSTAIPIPAGATDLQLKFWQNRNLQSGRDAGRLEFSLDNGTSWFDVEASGSGAAFVSNGYNSTISTSGSASNRNEFSGLRAWSGSSGGFVETVVNLTDTAKYAGKNLRMRWRLATDNSTSSSGWYLDSITLLGGGDVTNQAPVISAVTSSSTEMVTDPDSTVHQIVRTASTDLSATATDDAAESSLTYTWAVANNPDHPVSFTTNAGNAARTTTAYFEEAGDYQITLTVRDAQGLTVSGAVSLRVLQSASGLHITPAITTLPVGASQAFSAGLFDQFSVPMAIQPSFNWSANGGGTINPSGLFTADSAGGPYVITASSGGFSNTAGVMVTRASASVDLGNLNQIYDGSPKMVAVTTNPPDLATSVTYNGSSVIPTSSGIYIVEAGITHPNYQGSASGTLVINKAGAEITLGGLSQTYDGSARPVTAITVPESLAVTVTYDGSSVPPTNAGTYAVVANINDANHQGTVSGTLVVNKAEAEITLGGLAQTYDGSARPVTATTVPESLAFTVTYDGSSAPPTNAGTYAVVANINDANHQSTVSGSLVVNKASIGITLEGLTQTYDGSPKPVVATCAPESLIQPDTSDGSSGSVVAPGSAAISISYEGSPTPPTNAGSYSVFASISDPNYEGTLAQTLTIRKATAAITWSGLAPVYDGSPKPVGCTTVPNGLAVEIFYEGASSPPSNVGTYAVASKVIDANYQGNATASLVISPANDFSTWSSMHFTADEKTSGLAHDNADPDSDSWPNLAEYALGTDPRQFTPALVATLDANGFSLLFTRPANLPGITYEAESSDGLGTWSPALLELVAPGEVETLRARDPLESGDPSRRFLRLRFTKQ